MPPSRRHVEYDPRHQAQPPPYQPRPPPYQARPPHHQARPPHHQARPPPYQARPPPHEARSARPRSFAHPGYRPRQRPRPPPFVPQSRGPRADPINTQGHDSSTRADPINTQGHDNSTRADPINTQGHDSSTRTNTINTQGHGSGTRADPINIQGHGSGTRADPINIQGHDSSTRANTINTHGHGSHSSESSPIHTTTNTIMDYEGPTEEQAPVPPTPNFQRREPSRSPLSDQPRSPSDDPRLPAALSNIPTIEEAKALTSPTPSLQELSSSLQIFSDPRPQRLTRSATRAARLQELSSTLTAAPPDNPSATRNGVLEMDISNTQQGSSVAQPAQATSAGTSKRETATNSLPNFDFERAVADKAFLACALPKVYSWSDMLLICPRQHRYISEMANALMSHDKVSWRTGRCNHLATSDRREYTAKQIKEDLVSLKHTYDYVACIDLPELLKPSNFTKLLKNWKALGCRRSLVAELQWDGLTNWEDVFRRYSDLAQGSGFKLHDINNIGEDEMKGKQWPWMATEPYSRLGRAIMKLQPYGRDVYAFQGVLSCFKHSVNDTWDGVLLRPTDKIYGCFRLDE